MKFKGDIIITDPCYIIRKDSENDWNLCEYGDNMERLGIHDYLCEDTGYGDWSCTVFETGTDKKLGNFCADAGLVGVFLLKDVLKYNPDFDYHLNRTWTTTLIKKFKGNVYIDRLEDGNAQVVGKGNINFYSEQTGF